MRKALLAMLLLISAVHPGISNLGLAGTLDSSGTANITFAAEFAFPPGEPACLNLSGSMEAISVRDRSGLAIEHTERQGDGSTLVCASVPVDYLEYSLVSSSWTAKSGPIWDFDLAVGSNLNISSFNASLVLPPGSTLKGTNGAVSSGNGSLVISYSASQIDTAHRARMRASYELAANPAQSASSDNMLAYALGALVLGALLLNALLGMKSRATRPQFPPQTAMPEEGIPARANAAPPSQLDSNPVYRTLDETDREIIREIVRNGGKTTQAALYLNTHVPKATLSRRIASLENRGILRKSRKGNRNLITFGDAISGSARA